MRQRHLVTASLQAVLEKVSCAHGAVPAVIANTHDRAFSVRGWAQVGNILVPTKFEVLEPRFEPLLQDQTLQIVWVRARVPDSFPIRRRLATLLADQAARRQRHVLFAQVSQGPA